MKVCLFLVLLLICCITTSSAQGIQSEKTILNDVWDSTNHTLSGSVKTPPANAPCKTMKTNLQGVANAAISVTNGAAVTVMAASTTRCSALVTAEQGNGDIRCATDVTPTTGVAGKGTPIPAGQSKSYGLAAQEALKCIATTATTAIVNVDEETL